MGISPWNQRFFATTRGQLILLLRRASQTVEELAQALHLTDNAVRAHLATLERDGLVEQQGVRRGSGKPAFVYALTPEAERLFPKAYEPVLDQLLGVLEAQRPPEQIEELLRVTGRQLAKTRPLPVGDLRARLHAATETLNSLGGLAVLEETEEFFWIRGQRCPLAALVPDHPQMCQLAEALVGQLIGESVQEHCARGAEPHCCFAIAKTI
ncbi:MAG TPA: ArsR family transcriptional regulator [Ktedonobacterales bacterium]|nr:ArsR family transcriptional regulator [Ktedonobacterales bacterium]